MRYSVKVAITYHKELTVYAKSQDEAEDKATDIVMEWNNVEDCEVIDVLEDDD